MDQVSNEEAAYIEIIVGDMEPVSNEAGYSLEEASYPLEEASSNAATNIEITVGDMDNASNDEAAYPLEEVNSNAATSDHPFEEASSNAATHISDHPLEEANPNIATNISIRAKWSFARKVFIFLAIQFLATAIMTGVVNEVLGRKKLSFADTPGYMTILILGDIVFLVIWCLRTDEPQRQNTVFQLLYSFGKIWVVSWLSAARDGLAVLGISMAMLVVLTVFVLYTFWAAREGHDYNFYMPFALAFSLLLLIYLVALVKLHVVTILPATFEWLISTICSGYIVYKTGKKIEVYSSSSSSSDHNGSLIVAIDFYSNILNLFFLLLSILESVD